MTTWDSEIAKLRPRSRALDLDPRSRVLAVRPRSRVLTLQDAPYTSVTYIPPVTQLFYDTFTDTNGTLLTDHTPNVDTVGGGWTGPALSTDGGVPIINSNRATDSTGTVRSAVAQMSDASVSGSAVFRWSDLSTSTNLAYVIVRQSNTSNMWLLIAGYLAGTGKIFRITKFEAGAGTVMASGSAAGLAINTDYTIDFSCSGSDISTTLDGVTITYSSTFNATATKHGVRLNNTGAFVDDFEVMAS